MPYVFAQFLNSDATTMGAALATYHKCFDATKRKPPRAMLALSVIAADTDKEARQYASDIKMMRIRLESGRTFSVGSLTAAENRQASPGKLHCYHAPDERGARLAGHGAAAC